jgi:hypothetical protein
MQVQNILSTHFTRLPFSYSSAKAQVNIPAYEGRLLTCIERQTLGWDRLSAKIAYSIFQDYTGIKDLRHISRGLKGLERKGIITIIPAIPGTNPPDINAYRINTAFFMLEEKAGEGSPSGSPHVKAKGSLPKKAKKTSPKEANNTESLQNKRHYQAVCVDDLKAKTEPTAQTMTASPAPAISAYTPAPDAVSPIRPSPKPSVPVKADAIDKALPVDSSRTALSKDTLLWLYRTFGQMLVSEVIAIIEFQGSRPRSYIGLIISMCKSGYIKPEGYVTAQEKAAQEAQYRQAQAERRQQEAIADDEVDRMFEALPDAERDRLLSEAQGRVKGLSQYHQSRHYVEVVAKEILQSKISGGGSYV